MVILFILDWFLENIEDGINLLRIVGTLMVNDEPVNLCVRFWMAVLYYLVRGYKEDLDLKGSIDFQNLVVSPLNVQGLISLMIWVLKLEVRRLVYNFIDTLWIEEKNNNYLDLTWESFIPKIRSKRKRKINYLKKWLIYYSIYYN